MDDIRRGTVIRSGTVPLKPFGKARPRVTRRRTYMPAKYVKRKDDLRKLYGGAIVHDGAIHLDVVAIRRMPKGWSNKKRAAMDGALCLVRPDIDNILGAVMDALFREDSHIVSVLGRKVWGREHGMDITVSEAL